MLRGADGFALNLMVPGKGDPATYPDNFHVGFLVDKPDIVHAKHAELAAAGLAPGEIQELKRGGVGSTTFYCSAPGKILVEISSLAA